MVETGREGGQRRGMAISDLDVFPAFRCAAPAQLPLFFYHLPKTGGTTVEAALFALAAVRRQPFLVIPRAIGMRERPTPARLGSGPGALAYAGHCWFGFHHVLKRPVQLCTVLREPVGRVVSEYLWRCRYRDRPPSAADFQHYLDNLALSNMMTRLLTGESEIDWDSAARAIGHLESFFLVGTTERLASFVSAILTLYGGPTVMTGRAKEERSPLKAELVATFRDAVAARNVYDQALYAHAERHLFGRAAALLEGFTEPNPLAVVVTNPGGKKFELSNPGTDAGTAEAAP